MINIDEKDIKKMDRGVKKLVKDFIHPEENNKYAMIKARNSQNNSSPKLQLSLQQEPHHEQRFQTI